MCTMLITKANGDVEEFQPQKLRQSLRRAGAVKEEVDAIVAHIEAVMQEKMSTSQIYREAFAMLQKSAQPVASRYSLRRALFGLGPTGFPFEDFLTRLFTEEGYQVRTRQVIAGKCATHEVDLAAFKETESFIAEAKFHMRPGIKSDLQTVLYSYARYLDLQQRPSCTEDTCGITSLLVITNTKFTHTATKYAECVGLNLLSWDYPKKATLQDRIENLNLFPVTALTTLSNKNKQDLLTANVILCRDLIQNPEVMQQYNISEKKSQVVLAEAQRLCGGGSA